MTFRKLTAFFLVLWSLLFAASSFAAVPTVNEYTGTNWGQGVWHSSAAAACSSAAQNRGSAVGSGYSGFTGIVEGSSCRITAKSNATGQVDEYWGGDSLSTRGGACPANSNPSGSQCECRSGYSEQGGQCVNPDQQCQDKQGSTTIVNWTVGYTRTPDIDADPSWSLVGPPNVIPSDKQSCYQGCRVSLGDATMAYQSASPTPSGLYRLSMDMIATHGGSSCTAGDGDGPLNPNQPIPPCPGFVGEVNGKLGCYGTAEKPVRDDKPAPKPPAPLDKGNPSAGEKPVAGEGSGNGGAGRTPTNGNGGPAGGPAGAAGGTKPDGTTDKPTDDKKEQQNCGAPGQPKCGIDESGTPGNWSEGKWDSKIADYKAKAEQSLNQIKQSGGDTFNPFSTFFFAPPLAACEAFVLPNDQGEITRHCEVVEGVRSIMAYVWALAALWICLGWIKKATA